MSLRDFNLDGEIDMQIETKKFTFSSKVKIDTNFVIVSILIISLLLCAILGLKSSKADYKHGTLVINELMVANKSSIVDDDGDYSDWIEIYNSNSYPINLNGFGLSDDRKAIYKWKFPNIKIGPNQYLIIFASGKDKKEVNGGYLHTNFKLNSKGENLLLTSDRGQIIDEVKIPELVSDISYGRQSGAVDKWVYFDKSTPNTENGYGSENPLNNGVSVESPIIINEIVVSNKTIIVDEDGEHSDWIEIFNSGDSPVNLKGYGLSDDKSAVSKWKFPDIIINPKEYILIFASGKNRFDLKNNIIHTNFKLNSENEILLLSNNYGQVIDQILLKEMKSNVSYGRKPKSKTEWLYFTSPTPGEENSTQGFDTLSKTSSANDKHLVLNEAMALNNTSITDEDGEHVDWVEIYNPTDSTINLKGYGLSNDRYNPLKWRFPDISISPKEYLVVFASGKNKVNGSNIHTNFKISSSGETLLLSDEFGRIIDEFNTGNLLTDVSRGRGDDGDLNKFFFYVKATPRAPNNGTSYSGYALQPQFLQKGGFYEQPFNLEIKTNSPSAVIRYTLDGSEPTERSSAFSGPILINKTTVVRARVYEKDLLPSPVVTHTMFINKKHTLTTISLSTNPANIWDERTGIYSKGYGASPEFPYVGANYWKDMEKSVHFELYEPDGKLGVSQDMGIKIFGSYSRAMPQKSFSIFARDIYGADEINYPFFSDKPISSFKSILLRTSGQDAIYTKIRDGLMAKLAMETEVDVEAYRPAVLYINGQYWGIYNIREKISEHYLESNHGVNPDNVDIIEANSRVNVGDAENYKELIAFVKSHDMSFPQNYNYVKTRIDIKNYIDYQIAEIYCANTDNGNIKFWRERTKDGKWRWILYDVDWGFFNVNHNTLYHVTNPEGTGVGKMFSTALIYNLLKNQEFRQEFINRFAYHLNNTYKPERVIGVIDEMARTIEPEMPAQLQKWGGGSMEDWRKRIDGLKSFARQRPRILVRLIQRQFNLNEGDMKIFNIQ